MGLNWVEEIVSQLYKVKGYMVIENEDLVMSKTEYRSVQAHSDIDIIAIKDAEVLHVECQSWWGPEKDDEKDHRRLKDRFEGGRRHISEKYRFLVRDKPGVIKRVFVTSGKPKKSRGNGPWDRLQEFCKKNGIELVEINSIIEELVEELSKKYPKPTKVGREEGITRFLIHLIHNNFLKKAISQKKI